MKIVCAHGFEPTQGSAQAAGFDLRVFGVHGDSEDRDAYTIEPGHMLLFTTGVRMCADPGHAGFVFARSSMSKRGVIIPNSVGVIDRDYRGQIMVALLNVSQEPVTIARGERIAQLVEMPVNHVMPYVTSVDAAEIDSCDFLGSTDRGSGGFGSSGRF